MFKKITVLTLFLVLVLPFGLSSSFGSEPDWEENGCSELIYQKKREIRWENVRKTRQKLESSDDAGEPFIASLDVYHELRVSYEQACMSVSGIYSQTIPTESPTEFKPVTFWDLHQNYIALKKSLDSLRDEVDGLKRKKFSEIALTKRKLALAKALDAHGPQLKQATDDALFLLSNKELEGKELKDLKRLRLAFYKLAYGMIVMRKSLN